MSDKCGHCEAIGRGAGAVCKVASSSGGIVGKIVSTAVCTGVSQVAKAGCERVSHCSTTKSAE